MNKNTLLTIAAIILILGGLAAVYVYVTKNRPTDKMETNTPKESTSSSTEKEGTPSSTTQTEIDVELKDLDNTIKDTNPDDFGPQGLSDL